MRLTAAICCGFTLLLAAGAVAQERLATKPGAIGRPPARDRMARAIDEVQAVRVGERSPASMDG